MVTFLVMQFAPAGEKFDNGILHAMPRHFTPRQANEALAVVRPIIEEMMQIGSRIRALQPELWALVEKSAGNGGDPSLSGLLEDFDRLDALVHRIQEMGIQIKDLRTGLIDFPARRGGREVFLCWRSGEQSVLYWHEIEAGFAGRQLIDWEPGEE